MALSVKPVFPSDTAEIPVNPLDIEGFIPDATGSVAVVTAIGETVIIAVTGGNYYPLAIRRFLSSGTVTVARLDVYYGRSPV